MLPAIAILLVMAVAAPVPSDEATRLEVEERVGARLASSESIAEPELSWWIAHFDAAAPVLRRHFEAWVDVGDPHDPGVPTAILTLCAAVGPAAEGLADLAIDALWTVLAKAIPVPGPDPPFPEIFDAAPLDLLGTLGVQARLADVALRALSKMGPRALEAAERCASEAGHPVRRERLALVVELGWLASGPASCAWVVDRVLHSSDPVVRARAVRWIATAEDGIGEALVAARQRADARVARRATMLLAHSLPYGLPQVLADARSDDVGRRRSAVAALAVAGNPHGYTGSEQVFEFIEPVGGPSFLARAASRRAAMRSGAVRAELRAALTDDDAWVRVLAAAAFAHGPLPLDEVEVAALQAAASTDGITSYWARLALSRHEGEDSAAALAAVPRSAAQAVATDGEGEDLLARWRELAAELAREGETQSAREARARLAEQTVEAIDQWHEEASLVDLAPAIAPELRARYLRLPGSPVLQWFHRVVEPHLVALGEDALPFYGEGLLAGVFGFDDDVLLPVIDEGLTRMRESGVVTLPLLLAHWSLVDEEDPDVLERMREDAWAQRAVHAMGAPALPWLETALEDAHPLVREFAARCLVVAPAASADLRERAGRLLPGG